MDVRNEMPEKCKTCSRREQCESKVLHMLREAGTSPTPDTFDTVGQSMDKMSPSETLGLVTLLLHRHLIKDHGMPQEKVWDITQETTIQWLDELMPLHRNRKEHCNER